MKAMDHIFSPREVPTALLRDPLDLLPCNKISLSEVWGTSEHVQVWRIWRKLQKWTFEWFNMCNCIARNAFNKVGEFVKSHVFVWQKRYMKQKALSNACVFVLVQVYFSVELQLPKNLGMFMGLFWRACVHTHWHPTSSRHHYHQPPPLPKLGFVGITQPKGHFSIH